MNQHEKNETKKRKSILVDFCHAVKLDFHSKSHTHTMYTVAQQRDRLEIKHLGWKIFFCITVALCFAFVATYGRKSSEHLEQATHEENRNSTPVVSRS